MKAVVFEKYGPPEVLELKEVEKPIPKDDEVLIKIHAATVNRTDCGFRDPEYFFIRFFSGLFKPKKKILGSELAGEIESTGKEVTTFKKGDRVFGLSTINFGTHAEYICMSEKRSITTMPANMSYEQAAAVCDGLMLAICYIRKIDFKKARKILINGASGSIGSACVQLAKHYGAEVTAVCNTKNMELVKSLGADEAIDYTREDFTKSSQLYDIVMDAVGKSSFFRCKRILKPGGIYFSTDLGFLWQNIFLAMLTPIIGSKKVMFPIPKDSKEDVGFFKELIEAGNYRAVIDKCYPLGQIVEATKYVETGQKTGNVVITI
ncbi:MAG: NAD(P)-dependent alcohol dehydrogenase [Bacteroidota bacterium]|nr:NAD(P)-dependent alcohol dehydrogenase [Bacteroidota bacterium]MDP4196722.1 NAD(P)-dependent alcohol dehydrogenase [Bacteroidota bacterium]